MRKNNRVLLLGELDKQKDSLYVSPLVRRIAGEFYNDGFEVHTTSWKNIRPDGTCSEAYNHEKNEFVESPRIQDIADLVILRQLGKISDKIDKFETLLKTLEGLDIPTTNNPEIMRENLSKRYLLQLQRAGLPVPKTHIAESLDHKLELLNRGNPFEDDLIIKPLYAGECGVGVHKMSKLDDAEVHKMHDQYGPMLVQRFVPTITEGEFALVYVGGEFSHAIHKPLCDGFKVNYIEGKTVYELYQPSNEELKIGYNVLECLDSQPDVMRLDLVHEKGQPKIMEVEMINPAVYDDIPVVLDIFSSKFVAHLTKTYLNI